MAFTISKLTGIRVFVNISKLVKLTIFNIFCSHCSQLKP